MTNYEQRNRDRFDRSATWVTDRPTEFPASSPAREVADELRTVVVSIDRHAQEQIESGRMASGAVVSTDALLIECEADIRRVNKTVAGMERRNPGIARQFGLPDSWSWQSVTNTSIAFCDAMTPFAAAFARMGLDAAWWTDLRTDATAISNRKSGRQSDVDARIEDTAELGNLTREGVEILTELEPMVENALHIAGKDSELASFLRAAKLDKSTRRGPNQPPTPPQL